MEKIPLDIDVVMKKVAAAVKPYPKAALFELAEEGFNSPFEQLVACILSIRTMDEVTLVKSRELFSLARTPSEMVNLSETEIRQAIRGSTFYERKAGQIIMIAQRINEEYGGELPCDEELILAFPGVGIKCANLTLGIACGQKKISVDIHVHRITNRWGYISAISPERSTLALMEKLPEKYWLEINRLLVPFGKHICKGELPHCSTCPVLDMCRQVGVTRHH